jgi:type I restriction enzyme S subunit
MQSVNLIAGDLLMIRSNGSPSLVGRTALVTELENNLSYAGYLIRIRPNQKLVDPAYLNLWFSSDKIRFQIEMPLRSTNGINNINSSEVKSLTIPLPPLEEQKEIVRKLEKMMQFADRVEEQVKQAEQKLDKFNQSVLAKAFRGKLVPQDPNDEPASVLLGKIQQEKNSTTSKKIKK